ncbi:MAG: aminoacyl-tRNA hydrolase [Leptospiraceae bacterium]|nr:aminoacyl-tRNA hydrolase [Leptospiraceae bacterium]MCK6380233.1 aminoacyl-tRNA hydrolase [Leptospiraceae bacterium]NUM42763.1 aminoacyl-tRNA hydrolase [Leptospiraceae bacterium]
MTEKQKLLIVGLGNPGKEYAFNRHNIGFMVIDELGKKYNVSFQSDKNSIFGKIELENKFIFLLKPTTYMNLSGNPVSSFLSKNGILPNCMLVVHDEIDIPFEDIRLKFQGGHAGHNGLRNIIDRVGSKDFHRLRFGVGRPPRSDFSVADFVLSNFTKEEKEKLYGLLNKSILEIDKWIKNFLDVA